MLSLRQLRYFEALARIRHFGRAARECAVTQPALSMQIAELETVLGARLVERHRTGVELTETGREVAERARAILVQVQNLADYARHRGRVLAGPLRLGVIPSIAPYILPRVLPVLAASYPDLDLKIRETQTRGLLEELAGGLLDVVLAALPLDEAGFESLPLFEDRFLLAVRGDARAGAPGGPAGADALAHDRLLLLEEGHCLRDQALTYCRALGAQTAEQYGVSNLATLMQMVANGYGVTLLPEISLAAELRQGLDVRPLRFGAPEPRRVVGLAWRRSAARTADFVALGAIVSQAAHGAGARVLDSAPAIAR